MVEGFVYNKEIFLGVRDNISSGDNESADQEGEPRALDRLDELPDDDSLAAALEQLMDDEEVVTNPGTPDQIMEAELVDHPPDADQPPEADQPLWDGHAGNGEGEGPPPPDSVPIPGGSLGVPCFIQVPSAEMLETEAKNAPAPTHARGKHPETHYWGVFLMTRVAASGAVSSRDAEPLGGWQASCPFHKKNKVTRCKKKRLNQGGRRRKQRACIKVGLSSFEKLVFAGATLAEAAVACGI